MAFFSLPGFYKGWYKSLNEFQISAQTGYRGRTKRWNKSKNSNALYENTSLETCFDSYRWHRKNASLHLVCDNRTSETRISAPVIYPHWPSLETHLVKKCLWCGLSETWLVEMCLWWRTSETQLVKMRLWWWVKKKGKTGSMTRRHH